jgi:uncharacterized protein YchJ
MRRETNFCKNELPVSRILFLPDETAVYDMSTDQRRDNVRMPLVKDTRAVKFSELCIEANTILNSVPGFGDVRSKLSSTQMDRLVQIEYQKASLMAQLGASHRPEKVGRNDPCPCGSGKKFKKCHGGSEQ